MVNTINLLISFIFVAYSNNYIFCDSYKDIKTNTNINIQYDMNTDERSLSMDGQGPITRIIQDELDCDEYCDSHGEGRELGYDSATNSLEGCRNWIGNSADYYGSFNIPFRLDMASINTIPNDNNHRTIFMSDIREQAAIWNKAYMHDGTGYIVNFYEVEDNVLQTEDGQVYKIMKDSSINGNGAHGGGSRREIAINYNENGTGEDQVEEWIL